MKIHQGFNAQLQLFLHDRTHLPPQDLITPFDFCHTAWPSQLANVGFLPEVKSCTGTAAFGRNLKDACIGCATVQKTGSEIKPSQGKYINGHIVKQSQKEITFAGPQTLKQGLEGPLCQVQYNFLSLLQITSSVK